MLPVSVRQQLQEGNREEMRLMALLPEMANYVVKWLAAQDIYACAAMSAVGSEVHAIT